MPDRGPEGTFRSTVTTTDVVELYDVVDGPVLGSADVANHLGCTRDTARRKLDLLEKRGLVDSRMVGRTKVFWRVDRSSDLREWLDEDDRT
jgi:predicted ArsR family transcriptional regulator